MVYVHLVTGALSTADNIISVIIIIIILFAQYF